MPGPAPAGSSDGTAGSHGRLAAATDPARSASSAAGAVSVTGVFVGPSPVPETAPSFASWVGGVRRPRPTDPLHRKSLRHARTADNGSL